MKTVKKQDDLKPYRTFGLTILQLMSLIVVISVSACVFYNLFV